MDFLQKIGGRKFIMALIAVGVATAIELKTDRGLTATMAGFLGSIVAAFSVANYAVTREHMSTKGGSGRDPGQDQKLDEILATVQGMNDPEKVSEFVSTIETIGKSVNDLKSTVGQQGTLMVNLGKRIEQLTKG